MNSAPDTAMPPVTETRQTTQNGASCFRLRNSLTRDSPRLEPCENVPLDMVSRMALIGLARGLWRTLSGPPQQPGGERSAFGIASRCVRGFVWVAGSSWAHISVLSRWSTDIRRSRLERNGRCSLVAPVTATAAWRSPTGAGTPRRRGTYSSQYPAAWRFFSCSSSRHAMTALSIRNVLVFRCSSTSRCSSS